MKTFLTTNKLYLYYCTIWVIALTFVILLVPKGTSHLFINNFHSLQTDIFFKYFTNLGDGIFPYIIALCLAFFSYRKSILVLVSGSLAGILAQIVKRTAFEDNFRPVKYFEGSTLHLVDGVRMYSDFSFPSGHSATIFALCLSLATIVSSEFWKIVLFCVAVLVAFSRVYLSQHFIIDIWGGSIIGILSAASVIIFLGKRNKKWLDSSISETLKLKRKG